MADQNAPAADSDFAAAVNQARTGETSPAAAPDPEALPAEAPSREPVRGKGGKFTGSRSTGKAKSKAKGKRAAGTKTDTVSSASSPTGTPIEEVEVKVVVPELSQEQLAQALRMGMNALFRKLEVEELGKDQARDGADAFRPVLDHYAPKVVSTTGIWTGPIVWSLMVFVPRGMDYFEKWLARRRAAAAAAAAPKTKEEVAAVAPSFRPGAAAEADLPRGYVPPKSSLHMVRGTSAEGSPG